MSSLNFQPYSLPPYVVQQTEGLKAAFNPEQFQNVLKVLKRELKGAPTSQQLAMIETKLAELEILFKGKSHDLKIEHDLNKLKGRVELKKEIAKGKENFNLKTSSLDLEKLKKVLPGISEIYEKICLRNREITQQDYEGLKEALKNGKFEEKELSSEEITEIKECLQNCIIAIENCFIKKVILLEKGNAKFDKFPLLAKYVLYNPCELCIDFFGIRDALQENEAIKKKLVDSIGGKHHPIYDQLFGPKVSCIEGMGEIDFEKYEPKSLKEDKFKCLKFMIDHYPDDFKKGEVLISGGGPGGLMSALMAMMQGHRGIKVLEARSEHDRMRQNIVSLGKEIHPLHQPMFRAINCQFKNFGGNYKSADLQLLDFFGITDCLKDTILSNPILDAYKLDVRIEDIQRALLEAAQQLNPEFSIEYGAKIESILTAGGETHVFYKSSDVIKSCSPELVYVMEGAHSETRNLLGIDVIKESKTSRMGLSFYKANIDKNKFFKFVDKIINVLANFKRILETLVKALRYKDGDGNDVQKVFKILGRLELLLSTINSQYLYFTLNPEEEKKLNELERSLHEAKILRDHCLDVIYKQLNEKEGIEELKESFHPDRRCEWINHPKEWRNKLQSLKGCLDENVRCNTAGAFRYIAEDLKEIEDFLKSIQDNDHYVNLLVNNYLFGSNLETHTTYKESIAASSQVQRAEKNHVNIGKTHFVLGGDAESSTDPVSGSGMRTTFLRASISTLAYSEKLASNSLSDYFYENAENKAAKSMREEGLADRHSYRPGTFRLERYLSIAMEEGDLNQEEFYTLLAIQGKMKSKKEGIDISLSDYEIRVLMNKKAFIGKYAFISDLLEVGSDTENPNVVKLREDYSDISHMKEHQALLENLSCQPNMIVQNTHRRPRRAAARIALRIFMDDAASHFQVT